MLHSLISCVVCLYGQSGSLHWPYFSKLRHTGIRSGLNSWRNPHVSPFIHKPRSQYVHTVCIAHQFSTKETKVKSEFAWNRQGRRPKARSKKKENKGHTPHRKRPGDPYLSIIPRFRFSTPRRTGCCLVWCSSRSRRCFQRLFKIEGEIVSHSGPVSLFYSFMTLVASQQIS